MILLPRHAPPVAAHPTSSVQADGYRCGNMRKMSLSILLS
jgi:hypothetical protein